MRKQMNKVADEILNKTSQLVEFGIDDQDFEDADAMWDWIVANAPYDIETYLVDNGYVQNPNDIIITISDYSNEDWGDGVIRNIGFDVYPVGREPEFHPSGRADSPLFYVTVDAHYQSVGQPDSNVMLDRIDIVGVKPQNEEQ